MRIVWFIVCKSRNMWTSDAVNVIFPILLLEKHIRCKQAFLFCRLLSQGQLSTPCSIITPSGTPDEHPGGLLARRVMNRTSNRLAPLPPWVYPCCPGVTWAWCGHCDWLTPRVLGAWTCRLCSCSQEQRRVSDLPWLTCDFFELPTAGDMS